MSTARPILRLGKRDQGRLVSSEEFAEADFDEPWKYEREDGRLIVMAPAGEKHSEVAEDWRDWPGVSRVARPDIVQRVASEAWLRVDGGTDRIRDIGVYLRSDQPMSRRPDRVPDLMFEVVSEDKTSRDRDYIRKRAEYHRIGVREYVIIDRFRRVVAVLSHQPEGYSDRTLRADEVDLSPLLPGFSVRISEAFPD